MEPNIRKRRQLNYNKCLFCRRAKKKCEPADRTWPGEKCTRCNEMDLPCSENQRTTGRSQGPTINVPLEHSASTPSGPGFREYLGLSLRATWLRQLSEFHHSTHVLYENINKVSGRRGYEYPECLPSLRHRIITEKGKLAYDIQRLSRHSEFAGSNFAIVCTSLLMLRLQMVLPQSDEVYEQRDVVFSLVRQSIGPGDLGAALMMQEILLLQIARDLTESPAKVVTEMRAYFDMHTDSEQRLRRSYGAEIPFIPALYYLLILTRSYSVLEAAPDRYRSSREKDLLGRSLLHIAAESNWTNKIQFLLDDWGCSINDVDAFGRSPLHIACKNRSADMVETLLLNGAKSTTTNCNWQPLHFAIENEDKSVVSLLLARGDVDPNGGNNRRMIPLCYAAKRGNEEIVKLLLAKDGIDPGRKDMWGRTALSYAAETGHEAVFELLIEASAAFLDLKDFKDRSPLSYAAERGHKAIVMQLLCTRLVDAGALVWHARNNGHEEISGLLSENFLHERALMRVISLTDNDPYVRPRDQKGHLGNHFLG